MALALARARTREDQALQRGEMLHVMLVPRWVFSLCDLATWAWQLGGGLCTSSPLIQYPQRTGGAETTPPAHEVVELSLPAG